MFTVDLYRNINCPF